MGDLAKQIDDAGTRAVPLIRVDPVEAKRLVALCVFDKGGIRER